MRGTGLGTVILLFGLSGACAPEGLKKPENAQITELAHKSGVCEGVPVKEEVIEVAPKVWVAYGYDLANTILIQTSVGNVIIDAMSGPKRAARAKAALLAKAPGETAALILTHTHMDHVGGASVWANADTPIWATHNFVERFTGQYLDFPKAERHRGAKQHAHSVPYDAVPCSSIGARMSFDSDLGAGAMMPTKTFKDRQVLKFGDTVIELHEAPGETDDQLFAYLPNRKILFPGDNFYSAFPNLYTIRGTKARSAKKWANSLDKMRLLGPSLLVPSHTFAIEGASKVFDVLTDYRDAILWVFQRVVKGANDRLPLGTIIEQAALPAHLKSKPYLKETYGQVDWSARALYQQNLGWFDADARELYPVGNKKAATRMLRLAGGPQKVLEEVGKALENQEPKWAIHLLTLLKDSESVATQEVDLLTAKALRAIAMNLENTNGRAYLLASANQLSGDYTTPELPNLSNNFMDVIPLDTFVRGLASRLQSEKAIDVHQTLEIHFSDVQQSFFVTVRYGVVDIRKTPLPQGTPAPFAKLITDSVTWKRIALKKVGQAEMILTGNLKAEGDVLAVTSFMDLFDREM